MIVHVLYFDGCPNRGPAVELVNSVAKEAGLAVTVEELEVRDEAEAVKHRFLGSPTIQVDGVDVEPAARSRTDFAFCCRVYGTSGVPSREVVEAALLGQGRVSGCCVAANEPTDGEGVRSNTTFFAAGGAVVAAVIASACCWLPPLLLLFGVSAAGVSTAFASVRPWFLGGAFVLLALGFYLSYFRKAACEPGSACVTPNPKLLRFNRAMLWVACVGVLGFALFPIYFGLMTSDGSAAISADVPTVTLAIDGMSCEACASGIKESLRKVPGVAEASVSFESGKAVVAVDEASRPEAKALIAAVELAGFHASVVN